MTAKVATVRLHHAVDERLGIQAAKDGADLPDTLEKAIDMSLLTDVENCKVIIATLVRMFYQHNLPEAVISEHDFEQCKKAKLVEEVYWRASDPTDVRRMYRTVMPDDEGDLIPIIEAAHVQQNG